MFDRLDPIRGNYGLEAALQGVRLAQIAEANRAKARKDLPRTLRAGAAMTAGWWLIILAISVFVGNDAAVPYAIRVTGVGTVFLSLASFFPSVLATAPSLPRLTPNTDPTPFEVLLGILGSVAVVAFMPAACMLATACNWSQARYDPTVRVTTDSREPDAPRASAVLADDRVRRLYADLVRQIDDWNAATVPVNRLILLANAGLTTPSEDETRLVEDFRAQREEIERLVTVAEGLLTEGPLGTRPATEDDADDPLLRLGTRLPELNERAATLSEDARRLVAAREANAVGARA